MHSISSAIRHQRRRRRRVGAGPGKLESESKSPSDSASGHDVGDKTEVDSITSAFAKCHTYSKHSSDGRSKLWALDG